MLTPGIISKQAVSRPSKVHKSYTPGYKWYIILYNQKISYINLCVCVMCAYYVHKHVCMWESFQIATIYISRQNIIDRIPYSQQRVKLIHPTTHIGTK